MKLKDKEISQLQDILSYKNTTLKKREELIKTNLTEINSLKQKLSQYTSIIKRFKEATPINGTEKKSIRTKTSDSEAKYTPKINPKIVFQRSSNSTEFAEDHQSSKLEVIHSLTTSTKDEKLMFYNKMTKISEENSMNTKKIEKMKNAFFTIKNLIIHSNETTIFDSISLEISNFFQCDKALIYIYNRVNSQYYTYKGKSQLTFSAKGGFANVLTNLKHTIRSEKASLDARMMDTQLMTDFPESNTILIVPLAESDGLDKPILGAALLINKKVGNFVREDEENLKILGFLSHFLIRKYYDLTGLEVENGRLKRVIDVISSFQARNLSNWCLVKLLLTF